MYWCDSYLQRIESTSLIPGSNDRKQHLSHKSQPDFLSQPYGLTYHENGIFWSEFEDGQVMRYDLINQSISTVLKQNPQSFALKIFDRSKQPTKQSHPCESTNPCEDLCLVIPNNSYVCKCRDGKMNVTSESENCKDIPNWTPPTHCRENEFQCHANLKCIDNVYT